MKVLVTGGRAFANSEMLNERLNEFHEMFGITLLIHGGARGADTLARHWAIGNSVPEQAEPVPEESWRRLGNRAGNARNSLMLRKYSPDAVIAFPGGNGTLDMIVKARAASLPTFAAWSMQWHDKLVEFRDARG